MVQYLFQRLQLSTFQCILHSDYHTKIEPFYFNLRRFIKGSFLIQILKRDSEGNSKENLQKSGAEICLERFDQSCVFGYSRRFKNNLFPYLNYYPFYFLRKLSKDSKTILEPTQCLTLLVGQLKYLQSKSLISRKVDFNFWITKSTLDLKSISRKNHYINSLLKLVTILSIFQDKKQSIIYICIKMM